MRVTTSKSKKSESFYITKSYTNAQGKSTSTTIKKLGTLAELSERCRLPAKTATCAIFGGHSVT